jgi:uncharacterized protein
MKGNILITGGTGLIGSRLTELLTQNGYQVFYLSRSKSNGAIKKYLWNIESKFLEDESISNTDFIINLAGANVFEKKWTKEFKKEILNSRTESVNLIHQKLKIAPHHIKAFISASAIGYYGADTGVKLLNENSSSGDGYLSEVVRQWEESVDKIQQLGIRTVKLRIGIVLSKSGGALEKLLAPIRMGTGAVLGSGKQYVSWIHIDDLCGMFLKAIEDEQMQGTFNAVAPLPVTNEELTKMVAEKIYKPILLPHVPAFALSFLLGSEKAKLVIGGNNVSSEKIIKSGFQFKFPKLNEALENLLK